MELMIGEIFLKALVLCGILFLVARHEADFDFKKVVLVTCGITLGNLVLEAFVAPALADYMPLVASMAATLFFATVFVTFMVVRFCWVRLWKGILVALLFMGFSVGLSMAGKLVVAQFDKSVEEAGGSKMDEANKEALQMFKEMTDQSSAELMRQATAESAKFMPAPTNAAVESALPPPTLPPREKAVELTQQKPAEPPPLKQPADELPAFARTPEWQAAQAKVKVSAVLVERDGSNTAIVNGEVLGIGDILTVEVKKKKYRFKMAEITTDWVAWDPLDETDSD